MPAGKAGTGYVDVLPDAKNFGRELQRQITPGLDEAQRTTAEKFQQTGRTLTRTLTPAAAGFGAFALASFNQVDAGVDSIRANTGAVGAELDSLTASMKRVAGDVVAPLSEVGDVLGDVARRTDHTGAGLERFSKQILDLNAMGNQASVPSITRAMGDWGIETDKQSDKLDRMFRASQATGASVDQLADLVVRFGAPLRQMGFGFDEAITLMGKFEREGVNTQLVVGSLRIALGKMSKEGIEDPAEALDTLVKRIEKAGSAGEANAIALETFGSRAGPDMAAAIREGRFDLDELFRRVRAGSDTIEGARDDTEDWGDELLQLKNRAMAIVGPIGEIGFAGAGLVAGIGPAVTGIGKLIEWWKRYRAVETATAAATVINMTTMEIAVARLGIAAGATITALQGISVLGIPVAGYVLLRNEVDATAESIQNFRRRIATPGMGGGGLTEEGKRRLGESTSAAQRFDAAIQDLNLSFSVEQDLLRDTKGLVDINTASQSELNEAIVKAAKGVFVFGQEQRGVNVHLDRFGNLVGGVRRDVNDVGDEVDKTRRKITSFAGMTKTEFKDWSESSQDALSDISGAFSDLSDDATITADELIDAFRDQREAARDFKDNLRSLISRGAKPAFIKDLIDMGAEGALWAEGLAESNKKTTREFFRTRDGADRAMDGLTNVLAEAEREAGGHAGRLADDVKKIARSAYDSEDAVKRLYGSLRNLEDISDVNVNINGPTGDGFGMGGGGGLAASWAAQAMAAVAGPQSASGYRPNSITSSGNLSLHSDADNPAQDISGSNLVNVALYLATHFGRSIRELIHTPLGWGIKNGQRVGLDYWGATVNAGHYNHVHVADDGGTFVNDGPGYGLVAIGPNVKEDVTFHGARRTGDLDEGRDITIEFHTESGVLFSQATRYGRRIKIGRGQTLGNTR